MVAHVQVTASVKRPDGEVFKFPAGSYPAWALPLAPAWRNMRRAWAYECVGHSKTSGDGWSCRFSTTPEEEN